MNNQSLVFNLLSSLAFLTAMSTQAIAGPISAAGGGVVFYQAMAINALMLDPDFQSRFTQMNGPHYMNAIERLTWANGVTRYKITTDGDCVMLADTTAVTDPVTAQTRFTAKVGPTVCPVAP